MAAHKHGARRPPPLERARTVPEGAQFDIVSLESPRSRRRRWRPPINNSPISPQMQNTTMNLSTGDDVGATVSDPTDRSATHEQGNWDQVAADFEMHDDKLVRKWNEQIDSLLVFAGLFSAVITSFNVESYKNLQLDATEASQMLLITISQQLSDLPRALQSSGVGNATVTVLAQLDAFEPKESDVWVNGLWFASLVCSLIAASLAILAKQWLQRYKTEDYSPARERTRIREHRFGGLLEWGVPEIVAFLPLLLRTSLNLFFIGLIVFLDTLHRAIATGITVLISFWFGAYILSLILPSLFVSCPYKSPEATFFYILRRIKEDGLKKTFTHWGFISWSDGEEAVKRNGEVDVSTLATVDRTFADRALEKVVRGCLKDLTNNQVIDCVTRIISRRLHTVVQDVSHWASLDASRITKQCAESLINMLIDAFERVFANIPFFTVVIEGQTEKWIQEALQCMTYLLRCADWGSEDTTFDERLSKVTLSLLEILLPRQPDSMDPLASHLWSVLCTRQNLLHKYFITRIPQLLYVSLPTMTNMVDLKEASPVKICAALLSLVSLVDPDSIDSSSIQEFAVVAARTFDYCKLPPEASSVMRADLIQDLLTSRAQVTIIEDKKPGLLSNVMRALDDCLADIAPGQAVEVQEKDKSV